MGLKGFRLVVWPLQSFLAVKIVISTADIYSITSLSVMSTIFLVIMGFYAEFG
jgi:hypothetical protein